MSNLPARRVRTDKDRIMDVFRQRLVNEEITLQEFTRLMESLEQEDDDFFSPKGTAGSTLDRWKPHVGLGPLPTEQALRQEAAGDAAVITGVVLLSSVATIAVGALLVWWFIVATLSFLIAVAAVSTVSVFYLSTYALLMRRRHENIEEIYGKLPGKKKALKAERYEEC